MCSIVSRSLGVQLYRRESSVYGSECTRRTGAHVSSVPPPGASPFDRPASWGDTSKSRKKPLFGKIRFATRWGATGRQYAGTSCESADENTGCAWVYPRERVNMISGIQIALKNAIDVVSDNQSVAMTTTTTVCCESRSCAPSLHSAITNVN